MSSISGDFYIDWSNEKFDRVMRTITKKYNAEIHSQSTIEGICRVRDEIDVQNIERVDIEIFDVAYNIIGGGNEGAKNEIALKEEADHSLPYMVSVALLEGQVLPREYSADRIQRSDVQHLLQRVHIKPNLSMSNQFPESMPASIDILTSDGKHHKFAVKDYEGFHTRPAEWSTTKKKFELLTWDKIDSKLSKKIVNAVVDLESVPVNLLMALLSEIDPLKPYFCHRRTTPGEVLND